MENHRRVPLAVALIVLFAVGPASARTRACRTTPVYQILFDRVQNPAPRQLVLDIALQGEPSPGLRHARVRKVVRGRYRDPTLLIQVPACGELEARSAGHVMGRIERTASGQQVLTPFAVKTRLGWSQASSDKASKRRLATTKAKPPHAGTRAKTAARPRRAA